MHSEDGIDTIICRRRRSKDVNIGVNKGINVDEAIVVLCRRYSKSDLILAWQSVQLGRTTTSLLLGRIQRTGEGEDGERKSDDGSDEHDG
jgi:hypothetical protein